jgi:hypothetical protein
MTVSDRSVWGKPSQTISLSVLGAELATQELEARFRTLVVFLPAPITVTLVPNRSVRRLCVQLFAETLAQTVAHLDQHALVAISKIQDRGETFW